MIENNNVIIMLRAPREEIREIQVWIRKITVFKERATEKEFRGRNFLKGGRNVTLPT